MANEFDICVSEYNFQKEVIDKLKIPKKITIYDSTLRDGEQMPGVRFTSNQKVNIARKLDEIHVPQIEAGFPAVSKNEQHSIKAVVKEGLDSEILVLTRLLRKEVDLALDCDVDMILLFIAYSDIHLKHKLKLCKREIQECVTDVIQYSKDHGLKTSFSVEDSTRADLESLEKIIRTAMDAGADRIGLTDTLGCINPYGMSYLVKKVKEFCNIPVSVHCHNDFGFALPNAIAGTVNGAEAITTTVNGIGERAGNVPLEEFVIALKILFNIDLGIDTTGFVDLSNMVSEYTNINIQRNKPLVGDNAFSHESGIHVAAILNNPLTYECIPPELVGNKRKLLLGKHSGIAIIKKKLEEQGMDLPKEKIIKICKKVKTQGEEKGKVSDEEFLEIVEIVNLEK